MRVVASVLPPSATMTSSAPPANAERTDAAIHASSLSVGMMTANVGMNVNGYILIGGSSTRMGQSKVPLFLDRVIAAARPVFDQIFAVQRAGGDAVSIETIYEFAHPDHA